MKTLSLNEIKETVLLLLKKYHAESALLFGSFARGTATESSDIDIVVFGGPHFKRTDIFAFAEDLRCITGRAVDAFEISEINIGTPFHSAIMEEGVKIA